MEYNKKLLIETVDNLRIIDDAFFQLLAARKGVCQEILRTLLSDDSIEVIEAVPQTTETGIHRTIVLDCKCRLGDGAICNIEMQKGSSNDDVRRCRFHASLITANNTPKGTDFKDVPMVKILYITEYDALGNGQTVTEVCRCEKRGDVYRPLPDGETIVFANTEIADDSKQSDLLQLFLRKDAFDEADYPDLTEAVNYFKKDERGQQEMCEIVERYAKVYASGERAEGRAEGHAELAKTIQELKGGTPAEVLLQRGVDPQTIDLAKTCL